MVKNARVAVLCSFFVCGLGQVYNGQIVKGIVFFVAFVISALLVSAVIGFVTTPLLWIWGMVDAYRSAERINHEHAVAPPQ